MGGVIRGLVCLLEEDGEREREKERERERGREGGREREREREGRKEGGREGEREREGGRERERGYAQALLDIVSITIHKVSLCTLTALASDGSSTNTRVTSAITTLCVFMPVRPPGPEDARQYPLSLSLANQCSLLLSLFLQRFPPISLCLYLFIYLSIYLSSSLSVLCMDFSVRPSALFLCLYLSDVLH